MSEIECSNRPENLTDRKMRCFCIDAMPEIFSEVQQKIFFQEILKKNKKKTVPILDFGKYSLPKSNMNPYQNPVWARFFFVFF